MSMHDLDRRFGGTMDWGSGSENLAVDLHCLPQPRNRYREQDKSKMVFHRPVIYALDGGKAGLRMVLTPAAKSIPDQIINNPWWMSEVVSAWRICAVINGTASLRQAMPNEVVGSRGAKNQLQARWGCGPENPPLDEGFFQWCNCAIFHLARCPDVTLQRRAPLVAICRGRITIART